MFKLTREIKFENIIHTKKFKKFPLNWHRQNLRSDCFLYWQRTKKNLQLAGEETELNCRRRENALKQSFYKIFQKSENFTEKTLLSESPIKE